MDVIMDLQQSGVFEILSSGYRKNNIRIADRFLEYQHPVLFESEVVFQGTEIKILDIFTRLRDNPRADKTVHELINQTVSEEMQSDMGKGGFVLVLDVENSTINENRYVPRNLNQIRKIQKDIFRSKTSDIFVVKNIQQGELTNLTDNSTAVKSSEIMDDFSGNHRFVCLDSSGDYERMCKEAQDINIHLLRREEKTFLWERTHGDIFTIVEFAEEDNSFIDEGVFFQIIDQTKEKPLKHVCISGTAGMGKTVFIEEIAKHVKQKFPSDLRFFFNFQDFLQALASEPDEANVQLLTSSIIVQAIAGKYTDTEFGKEVLINILENKLHFVHVFLDGYDEVLPSYRKLADILLQTMKIKMRNFRLYVTTRPHMLNQLELALNELGFNIAPLRRQEQIQLLVKIWKSEVNTSQTASEEQLHQYAENCLDATTRKKGDQDPQNDTGEPLQCVFLGEINSHLASRKESINVTASQKLVKIYSKFDMFNNLLEARMKRTANFSPNFQISKPAKDFVKEIHVRAALEVLFPNFTNVFDDVLPGNYKNLLQTQEIIGFGLIEPPKFGNNTDSRPTFTHMTLAEFMLAEFFADVLENKHGYLERSTAFKLEFLNFLLNQVFCVETGEPQTLLNCQFSEVQSKTSVYFFSNSELNYFLNAQFKTRKLQWEILKNNVEKFSINAGRPEELISLIYTACAPARLRYTSEIAVRLSNTLFHKQATLSKKVLAIVAKHSDMMFVESLTSLITKNLLMLELNSNTGFVGPMQVAANRGEFTIFRKLSSLDLDMLHLAHFCVRGSVKEEPSIIRQKIDILQLIFSDYVSPVNETLNGSTPLLQSDIHEGLLECLIKNGADVNANDTNGNNILQCFLLARTETKIPAGRLENFLNFACCQETFTGFVKYKNTPPIILALTHASVNRAVLKLFKSGGTNFFVETENNETLLFLAVRNNQDIECLEQLIEYNLPLSSKNANEDTLLHVSVLSENIDALKYFIKVQIDSNWINSKNADGNTALHFAFSKPSLTQFQDLLMEAGADIHLKNNDNLTALEYGFQLEAFPPKDRLEDFDRRGIINLPAMSQSFLLLGVKPEINFESKRQKKLETNTLNFLASFQNVSKQLSEVKVHFADNIFALNDLLSAGKIERLISKVENSHNEIEMFEISSKGTVVNLMHSLKSLPDIYVPRRFTCSKASSTISETSLLQKFQKGINLIFVEDIGLTTLLLALTQQLSRLKTSNLVFYIHLSELFNQEKQLSNTNCYQEILHCMAPSKFARLVLEALIEKENHIFTLVLDGVSEINENLLIKASTFVANLNQQVPMAEIIVGIRSIQPLLVDESLKVVSFNACALAESDLVKFLTRFLEKLQPYQKQDVANLVLEAAGRLGNLKHNIGSRILLLNQVKAMQPVSLNYFTGQSQNNEYVSISQFFIKFLEEMLENLRAEPDEEKDQEQFDADHNFHSFYFYLDAIDSIYSITGENPDLLMQFPMNNFISYRTPKNPKSITEMLFIQLLSEYITVSFLLDVFFEKTNWHQLEESMDLLLGATIKSAFASEQKHDEDLKQLASSLGFDCTNQTKDLFCQPTIIDHLDGRIKEYFENAINVRFTIAFVDSISPHDLHQIACACVNHGFLNVLRFFKMTLNEMNVDQLCPYKSVFLEEHRKNTLFIAAARHHSPKMFIGLFQFYKDAFNEEEKLPLCKENKNEITALHLAIRLGRQKVINFITECNPSAMPRSGVLHLCVCESIHDSNPILKEKEKFIKQICQNTSDNFVNEKHQGIPAVLCSNVHPVLLNTLFAVNANVEAQNDDGNTLAHLTSNPEIFHDVIAFLCESGAVRVLTLKNKEGLTPLEDAIRRMEVLPETIRTVRRAGITMTVFGADGRTLLQAAEHHGRSTALQNELRGGNYKSEAVSLSKNVPSLRKQKEHEQIATNCKTFIVYEPVDGEWQRQVLTENMSLLCQITQWDKKLPDILLLKNIICEQDFKILVSHDKLLLNENLLVLSNKHLKF